MKIFLTAREVAELLGFPSTVAFNQRRDWLVDELGFPMPMPYLLRGGARLWRAEAVQNWIDRQGLPADATPGELPPGVVDFSEERLIRLARSA